MHIFKSYPHYFNISLDFRQLYFTEKEKVFRIGNVFHIILKQSLLLKKIMIKFASEKMKESVRLF